MNRLEIVKLIFLCGLPLHAFATEPGHNKELHLNPNNQERPINQVSLKYSLRNDPTIRRSLDKVIGERSRPQGPQNISGWVLNPEPEFSKNINFINLKNFYASEEATLCEEATNNLLFDIKPDASSDPFDREDKITNFKQYRDNCGLKPLSMYQDPKIDDAKRRLVTLLSDQEVICSGFQLSKNLIVTARHCFYYNKKTSRDVVISVNDKNNTLIDDYRVNDQACGRIHRIISKPFNNSVQPCDYIILEINSEKYNMDLEDFPLVDSVREYDKLILLGYHIFNHIYEQKISRATAKDWRDGLSVSEHPMCVAYEIKTVRINGVESFCVSHGCQSIKGMSGAPIFVDTGGRLLFAGIQIGTTEFDQGAWKETSETCNLTITKDTDALKHNLAISTPIIHEDEL